LPKQFCSIRSSLVAELATATKQVANIVDRLKVLASGGNHASAKDRKEIFELSARRNASIVECGQLLQKLGAHRTKHDC
jgi:hypothetical protein